MTGNRDYRKEMERFLLNKNINTLNIKKNEDEIYVISVHYSDAVCLW